ncbi:hypothetical protein [Burkholderia stagnalis]
MTMKEFAARVVTLFVATAIGSAMQMPAQGAEPGTSSVPPTAQPSSTVLANAARTIGVRRCYSAVDQVSSRMLANTRRADVALDWDRNDSDREPFFALAGLEYPSAAAVLSLTTVPASTGGCTILVERISSAPLSCGDVARTELRDYKGTPLVKAVTVYANPGRPRETVTLVDAPPSCLIIRRQVQYRWGAAQ